MICGDHVCINKAEANKYFEENLTIEVQVIDRKFKEKVDLVELNIKENKENKRKISITSKNKTNKKLKSLSKKDIKKIKKSIKDKKKVNKIVKKIDKKKELETDIQLGKIKKNSKNMKVINNGVNKKRFDVVDVCTIIEKCSIDEISKFLQEQGKNKSFPDITKID